jgi:hypothetical protein
MWSFLILERRYERIFFIGGYLHGVCMRGIGDLSNAGIRSVGDESAS